MLKRRPNTQYTRDGVPISNSPEPEESTISTPDEIKTRKIFRAKRVSVQEKQGFILKSKLISDTAESELLKANEPVSVNFFNIPDEEVKEISPEKSKQSKNFEGPKFFNPLSSILQNLSSKKDDEVLNGFISSITPVKPETKLTSFDGKLIKSDFATVYSVEASGSVNGVSRGEGFIEIVTREVSGKKVFSLIIKNKIKNVVYQASLMTKSEVEECKDLQLAEDDGKFVEMKTEVFRKNGEKVCKEEVRICLEKSKKKGLIEAFAKLRQ